MTFLHLVILALTIALGTVLLGWWAVPVLAALYGLVARETRRPGLVAAVAAAAAWGGYLSILSFGGAPVSRFAGDLAHAMSLPVWAPHLATMLFPALLAGPAAWLSARAMFTPNAKRR
ncbi:MAG: hypothetical protein ACT4P7_21895 [Gemmatimonadaceae bacterium]